MRRIAVLIAATASIVIPATADAQKPLSRSQAHHAAALIRRAAGPGTVVWGCHRWGKGILCHYRMPVPGAELEYENGERTAGEWESYAVVRDGRVHFA
jgi:hypothetical protein